MKKKIILFLFSLLIIVVLSLTIKNYWGKDSKTEEVFYFTDKIQSIEIINGTNGEKVYIDNGADLNAAQSILKEGKLIYAKNTQDSTGYKWRVVIKSYNHLLEISGPESAIYDNQNIAFLEKNDYTRFEECVNGMYNKYTNIVIK